MHYLLLTINSSTFLLYLKLQDFSQFSHTNWQYLSTTVPPKFPNSIRQFQKPCLTRLNLTFPPMFLSRELVPSDFPDFITNKLNSKVDCFVIKGKKKNKLEIFSFNNKGLMPSDLLEKSSDMADFFGFQSVKHRTIVSVERLLQWLLINQADLRCLCELRFRCSRFIHASKNQSNRLQSFFRISLSAVSRVAWSRLETSAESKNLWRDC